MKRIIILAIIFCNYFFVQSSMIHNALEYVDSPVSKAAVRKSLGTSPETAAQRQAEGSGSISSVDLPRIAHDYWSYLKTGEGKFFDLIDRKTKWQGFKLLGLLAEDVQEIEKSIRKYFMSTPSQQGDIPYNVIEFAHPNLPDWLAREYGNKTSEWFDFIVLDPKYKFLGPESIRACVAEYAFQEWNKKRIGHKKYWHVKKNHEVSEKFLEKIENEIDRALADAEFVFQYIGDIQNNQVNQGVKYIIIEAQDIVNNQQHIRTLNAILDPQTGNPNLKVVIAFDDQVTQTPEKFTVQNTIQHAVILGRNIIMISDLFMSDLGNLLSIDVSGLSKVIIIGNFFLAGSRALVMVDLRGFSNVTTIGEFFLLDASSLEFINLDSFCKVTRIGRDFLAGCSGLQNLDVRALLNLAAIESYFLYRCSGLLHIDLSPLSKVIEIKGGLLANCSNLQSVDLSGFSNLRQTSNYILEGSNELRTMKLTRNMYDMLLKKNRTFFNQFPKLSTFNQFSKLSTENIMIVSMHPSSSSSSSSASAVAVAKS